MTNQSTAIPYIGGSRAIMRAELTDNNAAQARVRAELTEAARALDHARTEAQERAVEAMQATMKEQNR